jgi:hypothetical protein
VATYDWSPGNYAKLGIPECFDTTIKHISGEGLTVFAILTIDAQDSSFYA